MRQRAGDQLGRCGEARETGERFGAPQPDDCQAARIGSRIGQQPRFKRLEQEGRILTRNWELYDGQHVVFQPARMSVEELQRGVERAWRIAYSPRSMVRRILASPSPWPVRVGANLAYRFYAHNLHRFYNCDWVIGRAGASAKAGTKSAA